MPSSKPSLICFTRRQCYETLSCLSISTVSLSRPGGRDTTQEGQEGQTPTYLGPQRFWHVDSGASRALLTLVLEARSEGFVDDVGNLCCGVDKVEVFAPALANEARVVDVRAEAFPDLPPEEVECADGTVSVPREGTRVSIKGRL